MASRFFPYPKTHTQHNLASENSQRKWYEFVEKKAITHVLIRLYGNAIIIIITYMCIKKLTSNKVDSPSEPFKHVTRVSKSIN